MTDNERKHTWLQKKAELARLKSDEAQALLELFEQNELLKADLDAGGTLESPINQTAVQNAEQRVKQSAEHVLYDLAPRIKQQEEEIADLEQQL
ncbi:hypothetical protein [Sporomusa termitida]|uniref:Uncharacterized protein n=1 Tax=Sporomusa termitida TaxID=2377 RepID=A0A517DVJ4_9FIRM|nr:hypothetical protein [Sporomusa termitida]QDR81385.1 hypothetical protein SPTER_27650 [Sporomusa termitida]